MVIKKKSCFGKFFEKCVENFVWSFFCYFVFIVWKRVFEMDFCINLCVFFVYMVNDILLVWFYVFSIFIV